MKKSCFALFLLLSGYCLASAVRIGIQSAPNNLNPFFSTDANSQNINRLVHMTLTDNGPEMNFICRLCKSYNEAIDKDGKHIIHFKLKEGLKFWDGTEFTAKDVENSHKYFTEETNIKSIFRFAFRKISEVKILGKYEVELVYDVFALENKSNLNLFKIIKIKNPNKKVELEDLVGLGSYRISKSEALGVELKSLNKKKPDLIFKVVKDETTMALKFIRGEIDMIMANISPRKVQWMLKKDKDAMDSSAPSTNYNYIGINHRDDFLRIHSIRKAISHLVPRKDIIKHKFKQKAVLSNSMFSPGFKDIYQAYKGEADSSDSALAKSLIESEGFKIGESGFYEKEGKILKINWIATNTNFALELVKVIIDSLTNNGIKVELTTMEWGSFMRSIKQGSFDLFINQWIGFTDADMMKHVWHSEKMPPKGANRGFYENKEFDEQIDKAISERDREKSLDYYIRALEIANNDYAYINLWHPMISWVHKKCIKNLRLYSNGSFIGLNNVVNECRK